MKFAKIKKIIVLGGSLISVNFLIYLKNKKIKYYFFTSPEQLEDKIFENQSLKEILKKNFIKYISTKDINSNKFINKIIDKNTFAISMGPRWLFSKRLLKLFSNKIVDFMGIPMPKYRGGAHYSWMILNNEKSGGCYLQNINENTVQAQSDTGYYYLGMKYKYPNSLRIPEDFFAFSIKKEMYFLKKFLNKIKKGLNFKLKKFNENNSISFPRLKNDINGILDWSYDASEIVKFINAFSNPYNGAITYVGKKKIYLKSAYLVKKNNYHPFSSGIIVNKTDKHIIVAAKKGIIKIESITDFKNKSVISELIVGERFETKFTLIKNSKKHKKI